MPQETEYHELTPGEASAEVIDTPILPRRRSPLARLGCGIILVIWFTVILTPCFFIALATQGELRFATGSAPGQEVRFWLVMESDERGIGMSSGTARAQSGGVCVQTDVRYFLWSGRSDPVSYCQCYMGEGEAMTMQSTTSAACPVE